MDIVFKILILCCLISNYLWVMSYKYAYSPTRFRVWRFNQLSWFPIHCMAESDNCFALPSPADNQFQASWIVQTLWRIYIIDWAYPKRLVSGLADNLLSMIRSIPSTLRCPNSLKHNNVYSTIHTREYLLNYYSYTIHPQDLELLAFSLRCLGPDEEWADRLDKRTQMQATTTTTRWGGITSKLIWQWKI